MTAPSEVLCPPVSRIDISWVCVATNDGHPVHLDHILAQKIGFKDVVVPAHLLNGWIGQYLQDWCGGPAHLLKWRVRYMAVIWPGDEIILRGEIVEPAMAGGITKVAITATSMEGNVVGTAVAEMRLPAEVP